MLRKIDHVNIVVRELERSVRFYTALGFVEGRRARLEGDWIERVTGLTDVSAEVVYLELPDGPRVELIQYDSPAGQALPGADQANVIGLRHVAFRVDDIDKIYQRLCAAGVRFVAEPAAAPQEVVRHVAGRKRLCYFRDPDGVILELAEYR